MKTLKAVITQVINDRLYDLNSNQTKAAVSLGISRGTLRKYMSEAHTREAKQQDVVTYKKAFKSFRKIKHEVKL